MAHVPALIFFCVFPLNLEAAGTLSPRFQGAVGSVSMSSGTYSMAASAPQLAASLILSGVYTIQNGFFAFLRTKKRKIDPALRLAAPANLRFQSVHISSFGVSWNDASLAEDDFIFSTGTASSPINLGRIVPSPVKPSSGTTLSTDLAGLSPNTTYYARLRARNTGEGAFGPYSNEISTITLAAPPGDLASLDVHACSISLIWASNLNPSGTLYEAQMSTEAFPNGFSGNRTLRITRNFASFSDLNLATTYYFQVRAVNHGGTPTDFVSLGSTVTTQYATVSSADPNSGGTVSFTPPSGEVRVDIPPFAFSETVLVTLKSPACFPSATSPTGQFQDTGIAVAITLDRDVQPSREVTLSVSYQNAILPPGTDESKLILARHDLSRNVWVPLNSTPDPFNKKVTAKTNHFSVFQIIQAIPSSPVSAAKAFPNPLRPSQGHTSMTFSDLPANASIRIYTLSGELVKDLTANASGIGSWDGTNQSGQKAASGVYFVLAAGSGGRNTFKVAIQR